MSDKSEAKEQIREVCLYCIMNAGNRVKTRQEAEKILAQYELDRIKRESDRFDPEI